MAMTEYYVSVAGAGAHDGTTTGNALTLTEMVTQINALGAGGGAGRRYNIVGNHTARGAADAITIGGTATSPLVLSGYNATIGDLDVGTRDSYGALDTTNMPQITYNQTFRFSTSGTYTIIKNLNFSVGGTGTSNNVVALTGANSEIINCKAANPSTNASCKGIETTGTGTRVVNCDASIGASGGTSAIEASAASVIYGCRATATAAVGIRVSQSVAYTVANCTVYGCVDGVGAASAGTHLIAINNTIYGCTDGIDIISTSTSVQHTFIGNHITDCSGVGVNFNGGTSGGIAVVQGSRFRDNGTNISGYADWVTGSDARNITTDTGGAATDYVDAVTNKNFALISTAPGCGQGFARLSNIGACGSTATAGSSSTGPGFGRGAGRGL